MRDPSEVIAAVVTEMREAESRISIYGWRRALELWADRLEAATPQPASADVDDAMVERAVLAYDERDSGWGVVGPPIRRHIDCMRAALLAAIKGDSHAG